MDEKQEKRQLYEDVKALVEEEKALRQELHVGDQYRAIPSRLEALLNYVKQATDVFEETEIVQRAAPTLTDSQQYVYVYLYNANGRLLSRWETMLSPRNLFEYSVNRPIYETQKHVDVYIRSRPHDDEHAFLVMKIEKSDVIRLADDAMRQDNLGQPLLKLKEGALREDGLVYFYHRDSRYVFSHGHLIEQNVSA